MNRRDSTVMLAAILAAIDAHLRAGSMERARRVMLALATLRDELLDDVTNDCAALAAGGTR